MLALRLRGNGAVIHAESILVTVATRLGRILADSIPWVTALATYSGNKAALSVL